MLTDEQIERYQHHIALKEVGGKGQQRLPEGRVLIIGAGGLVPRRPSIWLRRGSARSASSMPITSISPTFSAR